MDAKLVSEINSTFDDLIKTFEAFKEEQVDQIPFEKSWTAGQVGEHIIKSISNLPKFFAENVVPVEGRPYDLHVKQLEQIFLDFTTKFESPDFILPEKTHHDKEETLQSFKRLQDEMTDAASNLDLSMDCKSFEFPGFGSMTRFEWLNFFIVHTKRHTHQLKNILKAVNV